MQRTGEILRKEREARGLSIHEIGLSLKINSKILKAIEEGDTTQLPAKTFLRGFVQSYASYLKLNVDEVLKIFTEEMGSTRPQALVKEDLLVKSSISNDPPIYVAEPTPMNEPAKSKPSKPAASLEETSTTKGVVFALLAVVLAGLIMVTMKVIEKYQKEAQVASVDVNPIESDNDSSATTDAATDSVNSPAKTENTMGLTQIPPTNSGTTTPTIASNNSAPTSNPAATAPASNTPASTTVASPATTPTPAPTTTTPSPTAATTPVVTPPAPAPVKETAKVEEKKPVVPEPKKEEPKKPEPVAAVTAPATTPAAAPAPATAPVVKKPEPRPIELIVEANDNVEIEYSAGNGKSEKITLSADQVHTFKSKAGLRLNINNGGAVNVILNGKDMGVPGDLGKPIKLNY